MSSAPPTSKSGLQIHHGTRLEDLVPQLALNLADEPADPFIEHVIVVPNSGIGDWLQRVLPNRLGAVRQGRGGPDGRGILANFRMMTTNVFAGLFLGCSDSESRWSRERLLWFVHRAIDELGWDSVPGATGNRLRIADVVADLFDRYATHRPSMLQLWQSGAVGDGVDPSRPLPASFRWQATVYQRVCEMIDEDTTFAALHSLRQRLSDGDVPHQLPHRVNAFGFTTIGPLLHQALDVMSLVAPVDVLLLHPIEGDWDPSQVISTSRSLRPRQREAWSGTVHPLTARWGRIALETRYLVKSEPVVSDGGWTDSVLGALQGALTAPMETPMVPLDTEEAADILDHGDGSLQIHACHGRARQVEVLRDALLHRLESDHTLYLDDILIICPDIEAFAPLISAIFRSEDADVDSNPRPMRVRIAELEVVDDAPVIDAFMAVVELAQARLGVAEVLALLSLPVVATRFGLDDEAVARLAELADNVHIAFGIDPVHRSQWGMSIDVTTGTWRFGLTRLMMGLAVEAPMPIIGPGGVVPYDDVSVTDAPLFGALAEILQRLAELIEIVRRSHTPAEWLDIFQDVVEGFTASRDAEADRADLMAALDEVEFAATDAGVATTFTFEEIMPVVRAQLTRRSRRPIFRSGDITVSRTAPVQGVPYRVIAVLGADEPMFAALGVSGDDILTVQPCIGEPDSSAQGRQALLNAILAARDALIITCEGADIGTNKPVPLAVPLQELLEACVPVLGSRLDGDQKVFIRHPRQNFHPSTLKGGLVFQNAPFTFDPGSLEVHGGPVPPRTPTTEPSPGTLDDRTLDVKDLTSLVENPIEWFVHRVANVQIGSLDSSTDDDVLPIEIDNLVNSQLARQLVQLIRESGEFQSGADLGPLVQAWSETIRQAGDVPPGELGRAGLHSIIDEVLAFMSAIPRRYFDASNHRTVSIDQEIPSMSTTVPSWCVEGEIADVVEDDLVRLIFKRPTEALYLGVAVELALAVRADPEGVRRAIVVTRGITKEAPIESVVMSMIGDDPATRRQQAADFLDTVAELIDVAVAGFVPIFPRASARLARGDLKKAASAFENDCKFSAVTKYFFGDTSWEEIVRDPRTVDEARRLWGAFDSALAVGPYIRGESS